MATYFEQLKEQRKELDKTLTQERSDNMRKRLQDISHLADKAKQRTLAIGIIRKAYNGVEDIDAEALCDDCLSTLVTKQVELDVERQGHQPLTLGDQLRRNKKAFAEIIQSVADTGKCPHGSVPEETCPRCVAIITEYARNHGYTYAVKDTADIVFRFGITPIRIQNKDEVVKKVTHKRADGARQMSKAQCLEKATRFVEHYGDMTVEEYLAIEKKAGMIHN